MKFFIMKIYYCLLTYFLVRLSTITMIAYMITFIRWILTNNHYYVMITYLGVSHINQSLSMLYPWIVKAHKILYWFYLCYMLLL